MTAVAGRERFASEPPLQLEPGFLYFTVPAFLAGSGGLRLTPYRSFQRAWLGCTHDGVEQVGGPSATGMALSADEYRFLKTKEQAGPMPSASQIRPP